MLHLVPHAGDEVVALDDDEHVLAGPGDLRHADAACAELARVVVEGPLAGGRAVAPDPEQTGRVVAPLTLERHVELRAVVIAGDALVAELPLLRGHARRQLDGLGDGARGVDVEQPVGGRSGRRVAPPSTARHQPPAVSTSIPSRS